MAHHAPRPPSYRPGTSGPTTAAPRFRWYRCTTALAALAATAVLLTGGATAAHADPTVDDIERQIDEDWNRLEAVIERHNATRQDLAGTRREADALTARIAPLQLQVDEAMKRVGALAARAYRGEPVRAVNTLLGSRSPSEVVAQLGLLDRYARFQQEDVRQASELRDELAAARAGLDRTIVELTRTEADLAAKRRQIDTEIDRLQRLRLRAYDDGGGGPLRPAPCPATYPGGPAGEAVTFACAQIGKPYSWGAEGPHAYDCSGLMLAAWARAGVSLPHNAARQRQVTASVSRGDLRPGDLVFYFRDLHHVGMYVGGGWVVHASRAGKPIAMKRMDTSPIHSFGRPG
ncbi:MULTISPECIES: NlpC/P60 family protein [unclassified Micromonospora]|uniref:C40 family peptidase n=1 Tax=unclassified Micromonospora TaxID=2617518 RepID=UPI001034B217|nr:MULTISPECIES: NlpC/P60 family protein [unclassified Micromonospora]QKW11399.1 C40 family peptidase [Verrucosispora sp. NA02020]TBL42238.1 glycoside hydrolase [Verrucosispora sp. SN26_14.1]